MTVKEYQRMILIETGEKISLKTAKALMSIEEEHEAEAIAGGKYDVDPVETKRYHSDSCFIAMERGSECLCGLFPHNEEYELSAEELLEANTTNASLELADQRKEQEALDSWDIPF